MEKIREYARFLVKDCLKLKANQPILVVGNTLCKNFMNIVKEECEAFGSGEVFLQCIDPFQERELYLHSSYDEIIKNPLLDRSLYNEIAECGGALLSLSSPIPHIFDGVDASLLGRVSRELEQRISVFRQMQEKGEVPWCIAAVANESWAKELFLEESDSLARLWDLILDICHIGENPKEYWEEYFAILNHRAQILNDLGIQSLHYESGNGTDICFELPEDYLFQTANMSDNIVNMPSLEIFATPRKDGVNGVVYSSKPLYYSGVEIKDFWVRFESGKVVDFDAKQNKELLREIIETDEGSHFLGEVALVDFDSRINQSGVLFQTTLYDENACCHLALGRGFPECFQDGLEKSISQLQQIGMNYSSTHVDFMVGTRDLSIIATLADGTEFVVMKQGKLIF